VSVIVLDVEAVWLDDGEEFDAAYDLCGRMTSDELCASLLNTLKADWTGGNTTGEVTLRLVIKKAGE
jgi:hypothetical protein